MALREPAERGGDLHGRMGHQHALVVGDDRAVAGKGFVRRAARAKLRHAWARRRASSAPAAALRPSRRVAKAYTSNADASPHISGQATAPGRSRAIRVAREAGNLAAAAKSDGARYPGGRGVDLMGVYSLRRPLRALHMRTRCARASGPGGRGDLDSSRTSPPPNAGAPGTIQNVKLTERIQQTVDVASWPPGVLDDYPEEEVRAVVDAGLAHEFEAVFRAWLYDKDQRRAQRALEAAERSAHSAHAAARYAMWAAIISLISIIVTVLLK